MFLLGVLCKNLQLCSNYNHSVLQIVCSLCKPNKKPTRHYLTVSRRTSSLARIIPHKSSPNLGLTRYLSHEQHNPRHGRLRGFHFCKSTSVSTSIFSNPFSFKTKSVRKTIKNGNSFNSVWFSISVVNFIFITYQNHNIFIFVSQGTKQVIKR